jgi:hypothetical protein
VPPPYLALSHGYVNPDRGDSAEAKADRTAAQARITKTLGTLRKQGRLAWDAVLDLTHDLDQWQTYGSPREARSGMGRRYDEDRWLGQPTSISGTAATVKSRRRGGCSRNFAFVTLGFSHEARR